MVFMIFIGALFGIATLIAFVAVCAYSGWQSLKWRYGPTQSAAQRRRAERRQREQDAQLDAAYERWRKARYGE